MEESTNERLTWPLNPHKASSLSTISAFSKNLEDQTKIHYLKSENLFLEQDLMKKLANSKKSKDFCLILFAKLKQCDEIIQQIELKSTNYQATLQLKDEEIIQIQEKYNILLKDFETKCVETRLVKEKLQETCKENDQILKELQEIKLSASKKDDENFRLKGENADFKGKLLILEEKNRDLPRKQAEINELNQKILQLERDLSSTQAKNLSLFNEICSKSVLKSQENLQIKLENENLKKKLEELEKKNANSVSPAKKQEESLIFGLKEKAQALQARLSMKEKEIEKVNSQKERFSMIKISKDQEIMALKEENSAFIEKINAFEDKLLKLEGKNESLKKNLHLKEDEIFQILDTYKKELANKTKEIEGLKAKIRELETEKMKKTLNTAENNEEKITDSLAYFSCQNTFTNINYGSSKHIRKKSTPIKSEQKTNSFMKDMKNLGII